MKNTMIKVLSLVIALTMIVATLGTVTVFAADECNHTKGTLIETVAPTCQDLGYSRYTCGKCGAEFTADVIQPSAEFHNVIAYEAIEASCLTNAWTAGEKCEYCDYAPSGSTRQEQANTQLAHQFVGAKTEATCTSAAKFVNTCKLCGKTAEKIQKEGYTWVGNQSYAQYAEKTITTEPARNHDYTWVIIAAPSNTTGACTDGLTRGTCSRCGNVKESVIPVTHQYTVNLNPNNAVCGDYKSGFACKFCGKTKDAVANDADKIGKHGAETNYRDWIFDPDNLPEGLTIAKLEAMGFKVNDPLSVPSSCTTKGFELVKCNCGEIYIKTLDLATHTWSDWTTEWPDSCTEATVRTRRCVVSACNAKETVKISDAAFASHTLVVEVTAPTCTANGFTTTTCSNEFYVNGTKVTCNHGLNDSDEKIKTNYVDKLGHSLGSAQWASGYCDESPEYRKYCTRGCGYYVTIETEDLTTAQTTHTWGAEVTVPANCASGAKKVKTCTRCNDTMENAVTTGTEKDPNPNNHVLVPMLDADGNVQYVGGVAPTCIAKSQIIVWCQNPKCANRAATITNQTTDFGAHNYGAHNYVDDKGNVLVQGAAKAPTCQKVGYEAGSVCNVCGDIEVVDGVKKAAKEIAKDPNAHVDPAPVNVGSAVTATCKEAAYQLKNTTCCGLVKVYSGEKAAHSFTSNVSAKAPTCTEAGTHAYVKCQWCGLKLDGSTTATGCEGIAKGFCTADSHAALAVNDTPAISALGHDWKEIAEDPEECDKTGMKAHEKCARCGKVRINGTEYANNTNADFLKVATIAKHSTIYQITVTPKTATCVAEGVSNAREATGNVWCTKCDVDTNGKKLWITPKAEHILDFANAIAIDCTFTGSSLESLVITPKFCNKAAAVVLSCSNADCTFKTSVFEKAAQTNHTLGNEQEIKPTGEQKACTFPTLAYKKCTNTNCQYETEKTVKVEPTGCWTDKGVEGGEKTYLKYDCNTIAECLAWSCKLCGEQVSVDEDGKYVFANTDKADNPNKHTVVHTVVSNDGDDTCTEAGYHIQYCANCNYNDKVTVNDYEKVTSSIDNIKGHYLDRAGSSEANVLVIEKVENSFIKYICPTCNTEQVKDLTPAAELTEEYTVSSDKVAAGETFTVTYALSGVADKFSAKAIDVIYNANLLTFVGIEANAEIDGLYATAATKEVYISGTYYAAVGVSLVVANDAQGNKREVTTSAEGTVLFTLTFAANKTASGVATVAGKTVTVASVGNLNGDAVVTADDAHAIFNYIGSDNVAADVNLDGIVNLADVIALAKFAASGKTAADYLEMVGELDKAEAEVFAIYDAGRINDINRDGIANITDAYAILAIIETFDSMSYTELGNFTTMAEIVAVINSGFIRV